MAPCSAGAASRETPSRVLRKEAMENGLRAFAFLGIVEAYDASFCLLARTVSPQSVCGACCSHNTHPVVNCVEIKFRAPQSTRRCPRT